MEDGALGLSSSLQYMPDCFANTDELVALATVAAQYGGVYLTHQRSEGNGIFQSLDVTFAIAERAKIPVEIWHLRTAYRENRGKMGEVLARIEAARAWGTFARILGKYVRDEHVLRLEEAIRKMTSQPATRVHLNDRGILRPGIAADITVFDPATIRDVSTFEDPRHYSVGVQYVMVNGRSVVAGGKITSERPAKALRGPGYKASKQ